MVDTQTTELESLTPLYVTLVTVCKEMQFSAVHYMRSRVPSVAQASPVETNASVAGCQNNIKWKHNKTDKKKP